MLDSLIFSFPGLGNTFVNKTLFHNGSQARHPSPQHAELKICGRVNASLISRPMGCAATTKMNSPLFEIARVLVRLYHVASFIVNANHGVIHQYFPDALVRLTDGHARNQHW
jgi:hypothetical protein